jgi:hypothetical protein
LKLDDGNVLVVPYVKTPSPLVAFGIACSGGLSMLPPPVGGGEGGG